MSRLGIGIVGTGYAARKRAEAIAQLGPRARLVAVAGRLQSAQAIAQRYSDQSNVAPPTTDEAVMGCADWSALIHRADVDLVIVATRNHLHGDIVDTALQAQKHVVVEYPLALDPHQAAILIDRATQHQRLLHVEHIELLSGIHKTIQAELPAIGSPLYCRYASFKSDRPVAGKWSYDATQFGFPLVGALARIQRLIDLFGPVAAVSSQVTYWNSQGHPIDVSPKQSTYATVVCSAQLHFVHGVFAELVYGKGEGVWSRDRQFEVHGTQGCLQLTPTGGTVRTAAGATPITVGSRKGLFLQDTVRVLDAVDQGPPFAPAERYVTPQQSLYALKVATAAQTAATVNRTLSLDLSGSVLP